MTQAEAPLAAGTAGIRSLVSPRERKTRTKKKTKETELEGGKEQKETHIIPPPHRAHPIEVAPLELDAAERVEEGEALFLHRAWSVSVSIHHATPQDGGQTRNGTHLGKLESLRVLEALLVLELE
jgi:hypothetical protein